MIPAVLIAGTHSGVGKTTVTLSLMAALRRRGLTVQPFKVGPDFIDPTHHSAICGRQSRNLDAFMMGAEGVRRSFSEGTRGADVAVIEGVMGLYDGMDATEDASTAQVAKILKVPVLLVLNVHGMSRSAAAMELGYCSFDSGVQIRGTILNRVGSPRHLDMLKKSLTLPIYAALPRKKDVEMKSRHLGLEMGFERIHDLAALASIMEEHCDLDQILKLSAPVTLARADEADKVAEKSVRIGIAQDEAFCFYYGDNFRELEKRGAELVYFSPLRDELPDVDGLYIGGGYPELHAEALEKGPARKQIKQASEDGMPIYGECGGLMYLSQGLELDGENYKMTGALPGRVIMTKRLQALGYVEAEVVGENPVASTGQIVRGHEFHYSRLEADGDARFAYRLRRGKGINGGLDGLVEQNTLAGYLHTHFYSFTVDRWIECCKVYRRS
ncbi:MAG: hydrogenobyrinic acid a,c-diamide synthase (glutamine-hydrolyzing) [Methanotrichaceae archaeon]|nr:hydrogenobyrinic acid a,c-diamide synthase (glutamine-hydrolyzing) [Methanotrichaceae archaeon]